MYMKFLHQFFTLQKWRSQFANNVTLMKSELMKQRGGGGGGDLPVAMCLTLYYPTSAGPATITWKYLALLSSGSA